MKYLMMKVNQLCRTFSKSNSNMNLLSIFLIILAVIVYTVDFKDNKMLTDNKVITCIVLLTFATLAFVNPPDSPPEYSSF